jgi:hypothetical protein
MKSRIYYSIFLLALNISCDCFTHKSGYVLDLKSNEPIINAKVTMDWYTAYTDSLGRFYLHGASGRCPDWNISVTKDQYKPFYLKIDFKRGYINYQVKSEYENGGWKYSTCFTAVNPDSLIIKLEQ